jgi:hypothetical protein
MANPVQPSSSGRASSGAGTSPTSSRVALSLVVTMAGRPGRCATGRTGSRQVSTGLADQRSCPQPASIADGAPDADRPHLRLRVRRCHIHRCDGPPDSALRTKKWSCPSRSSRNSPKLGNSSIPSPPHDQVPHVDQGALVPRRPPQQGRHVCPAREDPEQIVSAVSALALAASCVTASRPRSRYQTTARDVDDDVHHERVPKAIESRAWKAEEN